LVCNGPKLQLDLQGVVNLACSEEQEMPQLSLLKAKGRGAAFWVHRLSPERFFKDALTELWRCWVESWKNGWTSHWVTAQFRQTILILHLLTRKRTRRTSTCRTCCNMFQWIFWVDSAVHWMHVEYGGCRRRPFLQWRQNLDSQLIEASEMPLKPCDAFIPSEMLPPCFAATHVCWPEMARTYQNQVFPFGKKRGHPLHRVTLSCSSGGVVCISLVKLGNWETEGSWSVKKCWGRPSRSVAAKLIPASAFPLVLLQPTSRIDLWPLYSTDRVGPHNATQCHTYCRYLKHLEAS
jgi:hypothetical protein